MHYYYSIIPSAILISYSPAPTDPQSPIVADYPDLLSIPACLVPSTATSYYPPIDPRPLQYKLIKLGIVTIRAIS